MKRHFFLKHTMWLVILFMAMIPMDADVFAVPMQTFDDDGTPIHTEKEVKKAPDRFIEQMEIYLREGNLESIGYLATRLVKLRPDSPKVRALYSIYLASKEDIGKAKKELRAVASDHKKSLFALCAKAMILRLEKKQNAAIKVCEEAVKKDKNHPYPRNILGRIYFDLGKYKDALANFQKAAELEPGFLPAYANLGAISFLMGNNIKAIEYFQKAVELNPNSHRSRYGLALVYENAGNNMLAIREYKKSLEMKPDNPPALQKLGELQLITERYKDALKTGLQMEEQGVDKAYEILGDAALHLGDLKNAVSYLEKAPKGSPSAEYILGFCFMTEGLHKKALKTFESVLKKEKLHFGAYTARASLKFYLGEKTDLKKELKNQWDKPLGRLLNFIGASISASEGNWADALKKWQASENLISGFSIQGIDKESLEKGLKKEELRHLNLGVVYYLRNLYENALSEFEKALTINKDSVLTNYWAGLIYLKKGDKAKAVQLFENAVKKAPKFFAALFPIGELNFTKGKTDIATEYYKRALEVRKDAGVLIRLGLIYEKSGEFEKAEEKYKDVTELYPDFFVGYNQLAWLYAGKGVELEKALALAKKADELQPGNASILDTMGWIFYQTKKYDKALEHLEKASSINPGNPTILYHLGATYNAIGNSSSAKTYFKKALELSSDFEGAEIARKFLN